MGAPQAPTSTEVSPWIPLAIAAVLALLGGSVAVAVYRDGSLLSYNDALTHMKIARLVVRGYQPGAAQLGGVWLPVQHLLMLPLIWNDWAFRSGVAGAVPSVLGFVVTGIFVYFLTFRVTHQHLAGLVALTVLASNPNVLYMQAVPMSDMILPAFITGAVYFLVKWAVEPRHLGYLVLAAGMTFVATLTRYEGWALAVAEVAVVWYVVARQRLGHGASQAYAISFGMLALYGIVLWFLWNALILGNPLYFSRGEFSASAINAATRQYLDTLRPTAQGNIWMAVTDALGAAYWNAGPIVSAIGAAGFVYWVLRERLRPAQLPLLLLLVPGVALCAAILSGDAIVLLPTPDDRTFNIRYGLVLLPAIAVYAGYLSKTHHLVKAAVVVLALTQAALMVSHNSVVTYDDATRGLAGGSARTLSEGGGQTSFEANRPTIAWFSKNYDSGLILIDSSFNNGVYLFFADVPTEHFLHDGVYRHWDAALHDPASSVDWIYMRRSGLFHDRVWDALHDSPKLNAFVKVYELDGSSIFVSRRHYNAWMASVRRRTSS
ncbi:MAG: hypothetical protein ACYC9X_00070 [Dehalococcoidia bacterium]